MLLEKELSGMMTVSYLLVRRAWMPFELGLIRDDSCFTYWFEGHGLPPKPGVIRDDGCFVYWFEGHGCLPNQGLSGMMALFLPI
jgi:hypothetical protein